MCLGLAVAGFAMSLALPAEAAGDVSPDKAIKSRQSAFYLMGRHMARVGATLKGDASFDKGTLELSADALAILSRIVAEEFPAGSERGNTKARPEVWTDPVKFRQLMQTAQSDVLKLKAAVRSGDLQEIRASFGVTSHSCRACHDAFKDQ
jgi:cytochrome c556